MSIKRLYVYLFFISALAWSPCFGAADQWIKLDIDKVGDVNTEPSFTSFTLLDSGNEVNGVIIEFGGNIDDQRRDYPSGAWSGDVYYRRCYEDVYRDFVFGVYPDGVKITLWELGASRDCNVIIYAFDDAGTPNRIANWYSNGDYLLTTDFNGGVDNWPGWDGYDDDEDMYAFIGTATADEKFGRIVLESTADPCNPAGQPFAFVNALVVVPFGDFVPVKYAHRPVPFDGQEDIPADVILSWISAGAFTPTHDIYLGTSETAVTDANRNNPLGVLVSQNQSTTIYDPTCFFDLNTTYYWRVDEVNDAPDSIFEGDVCSFKTASYAVLENFDSYADNTALRNVWRDYWTNGTSAEVSVERTIVRDGNSMRYWYKNNLPPYYSETYLDVADLGIDPNWLGIGAEALVLQFHVEPNNPFSEQMYVKLTDCDNPARTATVMYSDTNNVRLKRWNRWSIAFTEFTDVNLANVARITVGFGDGSPGDADIVYFEDITIGKKVVVLPEITGEVRINTVYQELEGFGAAGGWEENWVLGIPQPTRNSFYDTVFNELGLDIYRLRNTYGYDSSYINNSAEIVTAAKQRNPSLKILISAWSPQASLKSNGQIYGGSDATLAKDPADPNNSPPYYYVYKKYAKWWADSLVAWGNKGVVADYAGMQNEPDYDASWDSCRFGPTENSIVAGFNKAFEEVYQKLYSQMGTNMPKLLAPESVGIYNSPLYTYIDNLIDNSHAYGYAHHLYSGGGDYSNPDGFIQMMINFRDSYYGDKPLMQTEFSKGGGGDVTTFPEAMNLACLMHNSLVFENASAYIYWELFWQSPKGLVSFPSWGTYEINPIFYAFKHYSAFTDPGWYRVEASTDSGSLGDVRISAFKNPEKDQLTIVIINKSTSSTDLMLTLKGFIPSSSEVYRSSQSENWVHLGQYSPSLTLSAYSIITIHTIGTALPVPTNCEEVQTDGYGLTSDISGDCYVNYKDFATIADYWLNTECDLYDDCGGADFEPTDGIVNFSDLSIFAEQWMWCNDPEGAGCIENWP